MKGKTTNLQTRLYLISALVLLVGLSSAILIYLAAENDSPSVLGYEIECGNAAVFADDFSRWFIGLWHGKSLAITGACITIFISFGFFFAAGTSPSDLESDAQDEKNQE